VPRKHSGPPQKSGEGGKKVRCRAGIISQEPEYLSGPPHSAVAVVRVAASGINDPNYSPEKLLRKKKNESWTLQPLVAA